MPDNITDTERGLKVPKVERQSAPDLAPGETLETHADYGKNISSQPISARGLATLPIGVRNYVVRNAEGRVVEHWTEPIYQERTPVSPPEEQRSSGAIADRGITNRSIDIDSRSTQGRKGELAHTRAPKQPQRRGAAPPIQFTPAEDTAERRASLPKFWEELGVTETRLKIALGNKFERERLIKGYWNYRDKLPPRSRAWLHWKIDRFYYMLQEGGYISVPKTISMKSALKEYYRIHPEEATSPEAEEWMLLAGAYVEGLRLKKRGQDIADRIERIYEEMPTEWRLEIKKTSDPEYRKWLKALSEHWRQFVKSYQNDSHAATMGSNPPHTHIDKLESFIQHMTPEGHELRTVDQQSLSNWPQPLGEYAFRGARALYDASSYELAVFFMPGAADPISPAKSWENVPYWMKLGRD